jgi:tetratricopeptide (TPR) repeat protein
VKSWKLCLVTFAALALVVLAMGCGGRKLPEAKQDQAQGLPEGHPPMGGSGGAPMMGSLGSEGPTDDNPLPLKLSGINGMEELKKGISYPKSDEARKLYEDGFRKTFTADQTKRDYPGAEIDLKKAIELEPGFAHAYRALGYAQFNMGFNVQGALDSYTKAVEIDPNYGEAHYALAFMYAMNDLPKGAEHFKKAMELGVKDERGLGERFYKTK